MKFKDLMVKVGENPTAALRKIFRGADQQDGRKEVGMETEVTQLKSGCCQ